MFTPTETLYEWRAEPAKTRGWARGAKNCFHGGVVAHLTDDSARSECKIGLLTEPLGPCNCNAVVLLTPPIW